MKKREVFRHLTASDRDRIHALYGHGHSQKDMAQVLGVSPGTISRELRRYGKRTWRYSSQKAHNDAELKRSLSKRPGMKIEENPALKRFIIKELKNLRSPDEIAGYMKRVGMHPRVGTAAIYKWLYSAKGKSYCKYLCTRRQKKQRQSRLGKKQLIPERISLHDKPDAPGLVHPDVEGGIGLIRRWFIPKGTDLADISNDTYQSQLHLLNHKYRKSLGYRSAYEAALEAGIIDRVPRISLLKAVAFR